MAGSLNSINLAAYWHPLRVLISLAILSALQLGAAGQSKTVLVIYSDERLMAANVTIDSVLRDRLDTGTDNPPTHLSEFLDVSRFGSPTDTLVSDFLRHKYASVHIDVIVAAGDSAFKFLSHHQADLFTGIPVVMCAVDVVKHSGAAEAQVELSGRSNGIDLCISDSGAGFSPEYAQRHAGLGLVSMRERLRLVGGQLSIESEPLHGTRIRVHVRLAATDDEIIGERNRHTAGA